MNVRLKKLQNETNKLKDEGHHPSLRERLGSPPSPFLKQLTESKEIAKGKDNGDSNQVLRSDSINGGSSDPREK